LVENWEVQKILDGICKEEKLFKSREGNDDFSQRPSSFYTQGFGIRRLD